MPGFYELLAQHYDSIFPAEPEIVDFLSAELGAGNAAQNRAAKAAGKAAGRRIIDAACGTGNYTHALAARGFDCRGFDASEAMIEIARREGRRGSFEVRDLQELIGIRLGAGEPADGGSAEGLFCIGNSLPHLPSWKAVRAFFADAASVLVQGGRIVVQTVNFARFSGDEEIELPPVTRPDVRMRRSYRPGEEEGTVVFHAELITSGGERATGDTPLLAISPEVLVDAARDAGFGDITLYGSYDGSAYDRAGSFLMILTATAGDVVGHFR